MSPNIIIKDNKIIIEGHYDNIVKCAKLDLLCDLFGAEKINGKACLNYNKDFLNKLELITESACFCTCGGNCSTECGSGCTAECSSSSSCSCGGSCSSPCTWGCGGTCGSSCVGGCSDDGCTGVCGDASCGGTCAEPCGAGCTGGCSGSCDVCSGCTGCGGVCSDGCTNACSGCTSCSGTCSDTCSGGCTDKCTGCTGSCTDSCTDKCTGCTGSCTGSCTGCSGGCNTNCDNGCSGQAVTPVYQRLKNIGLDLLIKASDVTDIETLIRNEMTRRNFTPTSHESETIGEIITPKPLDLMLDDLAKMSKNVDAAKQNDIILKSLINTYRIAAIELYEQIVNPGP